MLSMFIEHFGPLCIMAALVFTSQAANRRAQAVRQRREAQGLRRALYIGVKALNELYSKNADILEKGGLPLISGRQQLALLRVHLGRINVLEEPEIDLLILAAIAAESAETSMAMAGKAIGAAAFTAPAQIEERQLLRSALDSACSALSVAESELCPPETAGTSSEAKASVARPASKARPLIEDGVE